MKNIKDYIEEKFSNDSDQKYDLFVDVGLSFNAPHSVNALIYNPNSFVIGIEPNPKSVKRIREEYISQDEERFVLLPFGVANVKNVESRKFNVICPDPGTSSFLDITPKFVFEQHVEVEEIIEVPVVSLQSVLDCLPWERFNSANFELKSDTQGYEREVVESLGRYIKNVSILKIEDSASDQYVTAPTQQDIHILLEGKGMKLVKTGGGDSWFVQK